MSTLAWMNVIVQSSSSLLAVQQLIVHLTLSNKDLLCFLRANFVKNFYKRNKIGIKKGMKAELIKPNQIFTFHIDQTIAGQRIDKFMAQQFPRYSRSFFQRLIEQQFITLNEKPVEKTGVILKAGDLVSVQFPPTRGDTPIIISYNPGIEIVFAHEQFFIVYKPASILVHPAPTTSTTEVTLVDWLLSQYNELRSVGSVDRPGIVHRLDKDTSGILIIPRTNYAHTIFGNLFKNRQIEKTYYAVVQGHPPKQGTIDLPIGRDPVTKTKMKAFTTAVENVTRPAVTHYKVMEYFKDSALVEVKPVTGRTHQIRVHLAAIGHPIIGDATYGKKSKLIERHALHAYRIAFIFDNIPYAFSHEVPEDFKKLIESLKAR
jgi:23S rRNA pseudouridine1911/1915/1917 synthase